MVGLPNDNSVTSHIIRLFEDGGHYTVPELADELQKYFPDKLHAWLKRHISQDISHLKAGTKRITIDPMNLQKLRDEDDGTKRWRLIND